MTTATITQPTITLSNFRVEYHAPRYEDGKCLYDGYCAMLADDAALDGATVRVFDVPDADEGQREVARFVCEAMNQHDALAVAVKNVLDAVFNNGKQPSGWVQIQQSAIEELRNSLTTTATSK